MSKFISFGDIGNNKNAIKNTWNEFRDSLMNKEFSYNDTEKAKETTFLRVFNDLFSTNHGICHLIKDISDINFVMGRGSILNETEEAVCDRFLPKAQFIKSPNRFSPVGVEWLYLALEDTVKAIDIAKQEIHVSSGKRFGFCYFEFEKNSQNGKIVDLTIADDYEYDDFNDALESYIQKIFQQEKTKAILLRKLPRRNEIVNQKEFEKVFLQWGVNTYCKLLSEEIFMPIDTDDKDIEYAPFQTLAQYFLTLGFCGIIYKSTVCKGGKNLVLFDKNLAHPTGTIVDEIIE